MTPGKCEAALNDVREYAMESGVNCRVFEAFGKIVLCFPDGCNETVRDIDEAIEIICGHASDGTYPLPPTVNELAGTYSGLSKPQQADVILVRELPSPSQLQRERCILRFLGALKGFYVFVKEQSGTILTWILLIGGIDSGLVAIDKYYRIASKELAPLMEVASKCMDIPASEFRIANPPPDLMLPPSSPIFLSETGSGTAFTTTSTTTTTTPGDGYSDPGLDEIPPGSGLVPYSHSWPIA